jgi:hypothetical protein
MQPIPLCVSGSEVKRRGSALPSLAPSQFHPLQPKRKESKREKNKLQAHYFNDPRFTQWLAYVSRLAFSLLTPSVRLPFFPMGVVTFPMAFACAFWICQVSERKKIPNDKKKYPVLVPKEKALDSKQCCALPNFWILSYNLVPSDDANAM